MVGITNSITVTDSQITSASAVTHGGAFYSVITGTLTA